MHDYPAIRSDLRDDNRGMHVIRGLYSADEVEEYRDYCHRFMKRAPVIYERINTDTMFDYVHPRSHDNVPRTYRIYQFLHNHTDDISARIIERALRIRDEIESAWLDDTIYRAEKEKLQSYVIVTRYMGDVGMLPIHQDYSGPAPLPLIQFWVSLSQMGVDYQKGNLVLHTRSGKSIRVEEDLSIKAGDAVIFDKSLFHEVEETLLAPDSKWGRWTVLIGARADRDSNWNSLRKRLRYNRLVKTVGSRLKRTVRFGTSQA